jgi:hypothetical protein
MAAEVGDDLEVREHVLLDPRLLRICGNNVRTGQENAFSSDAPWRRYFPVFHYQGETYFKRVILLKPGPAHTR